MEEAFLQRNYGREYGELYKPDSMSLGGGRGNGQRFGSGGMGSSDVKLQYIDDDPESYPNIFDNAKTDTTKADQMRLIEALKLLSSNMNPEKAVDIEEVIRYFVVHNFVCNGDSYTGTIVHNYYLYEKDGKLSMIPWDYNLAFGAFEAGADAKGLINYPIDDPVSGGETSSRPMIAWIFENDEYTELYHSCLEELIQSYFDSGYFTEMVDSVSEMIAPYVDKDPSKFCTSEEFQKGISTLKSFCLLRAQSVSGQLNGTVPSTEEGQKAEDAALVDDQGIVISDMGSMR